MEMQWNRAPKTAAVSLSPPLLLLHTSVFLAPAAAGQPPSPPLLHAPCRPPLERRNRCPCRHLSIHLQQTRQAEFDRRLC